MRHFLRALRPHLASMALAGASLLAVAAAEAKDITVWCWDPNFNVAIMKEAGERYAKTHPDVHINVVDFAKADVEQKLQTGLSAGTATRIGHMRTITRDHRILFRPRIGGDRRFSPALQVL